MEGVERSGCLLRMGDRPQEWNQFTALRDPTTGTPLTFDAPLQVKYTHSQTNNTKPDYKYNDTTFYLEYNGFGDLWGIPGKCVDWDNWCRYLLQWRRY